MLHRDPPRVRSTTVDVRRATAQDLPEMALVDSRAFGMHYSDADQEDFRPLFEPDRFLLARDLDNDDGGRQRGTAAGSSGSRARSRST